MTQLIIPYLSQFYPLIIGIIIFALLKSLNMLKHKTRIDLDTTITKEDIGSYGSTNLNGVEDIKDLSEEPDKTYSFYRYIYLGMNRFGNYVTISAEPRKAALSSIVTDRLIIEGICSRKVSESEALETAARRFGIIDLYRCNSVSERVKGHNQLELAFPDKASFLNKILDREEWPCILLIPAAGYNLSMV